MYLRHTLTEKEVTKTLRELLGNPQYMAQVSRYKIVLGFPIGNYFYGFSPDACFARFSAMWRDMGREGFEEAVYWLELLIKYGNLDHLRINDFDLNLVQYLCLDVLAFYLLVLSVLLSSIFWLTRVTMIKWLEKTRLQRPIIKGSSSVKKKAV